MGLGLCADAGLQGLLLAVERRYRKLTSTGDTSSEGAEAEFQPAAAQRESLCRPGSAGAA